MLGMHLLVAALVARCNETTINRCPLDERQHNAVGSRQHNIALYGIHPPEHPAVRIATAPATVYRGAHIEHH